MSKLTIFDFDVISSLTPQMVMNGVRKYFKGSTLRRANKLRRLLKKELERMEVVDE